MQKLAKGKGGVLQAKEQQVQNPQSEIEIYLLDKRKADQCDWNLTREQPLKDNFVLFVKVILSFQLFGSTNSVDSFFTLHISYK